ncbi:hypothetical protein OAH00_00725 [bacterium]|nr:hypothetical protein [bacterium]
MNEITFFYSDEILEEVKGPYTYSQLEYLRFTNSITDQTKVAVEGSKEWVNYSDIYTIISKDKERQEKEDQKRDKEEKQRGHIEAMAPFVAFTSQLNGVSYLNLTPMERFRYYEKIEQLAKEFEKRSLHKEEIQFLKAWSILKDKDLGENLLAKVEMNRIQESKGTGSTSSVIKWMGLMAVGQSLARDKLRSMESDLDRLADGIIGEDDVEDGGEGFGEFM